MAEVERSVRRIGEQAVGVQALPARPQPAQPGSGLGLIEPDLPESVPEETAPVDLERPGTQVAGDVEARVDVGEPGLPRPWNADPVPEQRRIALRHRAQ